MKEELQKQFEEFYANGFFPIVSEVNYRHRKLTPEKVKRWMEAAFIQGHRVKDKKTLQRKFSTTTGKDIEL